MFFDLYVNVPMQKIFTDRLRPAGMSDAYGVEQARDLLATSYAMIDRAMETNIWAMGETFGMADCAAAPALNYADNLVPLSAAHKNAAAYLQRLKERRSFSRVLREAEPYLKLLPK